MQAVLVNPIVAKILKIGCWSLSERPALRETILTLLWATPAHVKTESIWPEIKMNFALVIECDSGYTDNSTG
jgi:hypothetical protein